MPENGFDYVEKRYWKISDSAEYSDLVKTLTLVEGTESHLIPEELANKFGLTEFNSMLSNNTLTVPDSVYLAFTGDLNHQVFFNTIINHSGNEGIKAYYESVDAINDDGSEVLGAFVKDTAKLVIQFYTFTSILYASMYKGRTGGAGLPTYIDNIIINVARDSAAHTISSVSTVPYDTIYGDRGPILSYRLDKLIDAIYQVEMAMNVKTELFNSTVNANIKLNRDFENNDLIIRSKEDEFNKERSYVITMMSKDKRIAKQYRRKNIMFIVLLILFLLYIFFMAALYYAGACPAVSALNNNLVGNILVGLNASALLGIVMYYVLRYLFKNKFFF